MNVIKIGRIIGIIFGCFQYYVFLVKVDKLFFFRGYFVFFNCYVIGNMNEVFFREGDFGFGVFVIEKDDMFKFLGIVFVYMNL